MKKRTNNLDLFWEEKGQWKGAGEILVGILILALLIIYGLYSRTPSYTSNYEGREFTMKYPKGWYVREEDDEFTKEKFVIFSNYEGKYDKGNAPNDYLAYFISIYSREETQIMEEFNSIKNLYENFFDEIIYYDAGSDKTIKLYIIKERTEEKDNMTWDRQLPDAKAFLEDDKYAYMFYIATEIPSGSEGLEKEVDALKFSLASFMLKR